MTSQIYTDFSNSNSNTFYVNPIGDVYKDKNNPDIKKIFPYKNVKKIKNDYSTLKARLEDEKLLHESYKIQLTIWSITASLFILCFLVFIRKASKL